MSAIFYRLSDDPSDVTRIAPTGDVYSPDNFQITADEVLMLLVEANHAIPETPQPGTASHDARPAEQQEAPHDTD